MNWVQTCMTLQQQQQQRANTGISVSFLSVSTLTFTHVQTTPRHCPMLWDLSVHFFLFSFVWLSGGQRFSFVHVGGWGENLSGLNCLVTICCVPIGCCAGKWSHLSEPNYWTTSGKYLSCMLSYGVISVHHSYKTYNQWQSRMLISELTKQIAKVQSCFNVLIL